MELGWRRSVGFFLLLEDVVSAPAAAVESVVTGFSLNSITILCTSGGALKSVISLGAGEFSRRGEPPLSFMIVSGLLPLGEFSSEISYVAALLGVQTTPSLSI